MSEREKARFPNNTQRLTVIGRTGSGKTQAAMYHLSRRNLDNFPWVILNYKNEESIDSIQNAEHIDYGSKIRSSGVHVLHPLPGEEEEITSFLWRLWQRERVGLYADEGYMVGDKNPAFNAVLTQGRSKHIPMIVLSQRPVWMSRFVFSEADFIQVFSLNDRRDKKTIESFVPINLDANLADYHSHYFDVGRNKLWKFKPVPEMDEILDTIDKKLYHKRRSL
jgi:hypothetical protein